MKVKILLLVLLLFPALSSAANISKTKTIKSITVYKTYVVIRFTPDAAGSEVEQCAIDSPNKGAVVLEFDNNKEQYSAILAAYASNNPEVGFGVSDCRAGNGNNHPLIYRVDVGS